jgi:hypothetical protein
MKLALFFGALFTLSAMQMVHADEANEHRDGPCIKVMEACKAAGFGKGGKSLSRDCMQPLMNNQKIAGVTADPKDLAECKAKKSEIKK